MGYQGSIQNTAWHQQHLGHVVLQIAFKEFKKAKLNFEVYFKFQMHGHKFYNFIPSVEAPHS